MTATETGSRSVNTAEFVTIVILVAVVSAFGGYLFGKQPDRPNQHESKPEVTTKALANGTFLVTDEATGEIRHYKRSNDYTLVRPPGGWHANDARTDAIIGMIDKELERRRNKGSLNVDPTDEELIEDLRSFADGSTTQPADTRR